MRILISQNLWCLFLVCNIIFGCQSASKHSGLDDIKIAPSSNELLSEFIETTSPSGGAAAMYMFVAPMMSEPCDANINAPTFVKAVPGLSSRFYLHDNAPTDGAILVRGNALRVYVCNAEPGKPLLKVVIQPASGAEPITIFDGGSSDFIVKIRWVPPLNLKTGDYTVIAQFDGMEDKSDTFTLMNASQPTIVVDPASVKRGGTVALYLAGFTQGSEPLHIYRGFSQSADANYVGRIENVPLASDGTGHYLLQLPEGWEPGFYTVDVDPGEARRTASKISYSENRFTVTE